MEIIIAIVVTAVALFYLVRHFQKLTSGEVQLRLRLRSKLKAPSRIPSPM